MMSTLSVIIIAHNEEANLPRCLESVSFADEIVVVDSHSTDRTREIAERFHCKYFDLDWQGYGAAKQSALDRATGEWVLSLDADEAVSDELRSEIKAVVSGQPKCDGYEMPRLTEFLGRWIRHCGWYPDYLIRLFRRSQGSFKIVAVHEQIVVSGTVGRLRGNILHHSYPNLEMYFAKSNRYTTLGAEEAFRSGNHAGALDLIVRPPVSFFKHYVQHAGFLDGVHGLLVSALSASAVLNKYAKLWNLHRRSDKGSTNR